MQNRSTAAAGYDAVIKYAITPNADSFALGVSILKSIEKTHDIKWFIRERENGKQQNISLHNYVTIVRF